MEVCSKIAYDAHDRMEHYSWFEEVMHKLFGVDAAPPGHPCSWKTELN